ncbi:MAG: hypothetical protein IJT94_04645 [Oscillibacter sp.]|nr:hypothetical protein [Oscillibacter sp.]
MDFMISVTTHGRAAGAACLALQKPLELTRVAFGKGTLPVGIPLADVHQLYDYVADGTIGDRRHDGEQLSLTVQYCNLAHQEIPTFYLSEFMVYCLNPATGQETDLLYGNLGDYIQPVPAYTPGLPESTFLYPITLVLSSEVNVNITAPGGLVTYSELIRLLDDSGIGTSIHDLTIPTDGWTADTDTGGQYALMCDIPVEKCTERMTPNLTVPPAGMPAAMEAELAPYARAVSDAVRVYAKRAPAVPIDAAVALSGMMPYIRIIEDAGGLPPATADTVGGVKASDSLVIDPDGTAHAVFAPDSFASDEEVTGMLDELLPVDADDEGSGEADDNP